MCNRTETVEEFLARGGKVETVPQGMSNDKAKHPSLKFCRCGCNGNYTEHSMRRGEKGLF